MIADEAKGPTYAVVVRGAINYFLNSGVCRNSGWRDHRRAERGRQLENRHQSQKLRFLEENWREGHRWVAGRLCCCRSATLVL